PLAAGELAGLAVEIVGEVQGPRRLSDLLLDDVGLLAGHLEGEGDVAAHAHVWVERIGLEHHSEPPLRRADCGGVLAVDEDLSRRHVLETSDQAQKGRLAAAGRPDEDGELAVLDVEINAVDDVDGAERLPDRLELDAAHRRILPLPATLPRRRSVPGRAASARTSRGRGLAQSRELRPPTASPRRSP